MKVAEGLYGEKHCLYPAHGTPSVTLDRLVELSSTCWSSSWAERCVSRSVYRTGHRDADTTGAKVETEAEKGVGKAATKGICQFFNNR
jgi:hypothetical protein